MQALETAAYVLLTNIGLYFLFWLSMRQLFTDHTLVLRQPIDTHKKAGLRELPKLGLEALEKFAVPFTEQERQRQQPETFAIYVGSGDTVYLCSDDTVYVDGILAIWVFEIVASEENPIVTEFFAVEEEWRSYRNRHFGYAGECKSPEAFLRWLTNQPVGENEVLFLKKE